MNQPELGKIVFELRQKKSLTQGELAQKCKLSLRTVQRIEAGKTTARSFTVKQLLNELDFDSVFSTQNISNINDYIIVKKAMNRIEIPLSKNKIMLGLIGALVFQVLGVLFCIKPSMIVSPIIWSLTLIQTIGIIEFALFTVLFIYWLIKLFDKKPGLIIDDNGITDNTNALSIGLIEWTDIIDIKTYQIMSNKCLLIITAHPEKYLNMAKGKKQKMMELNMKFCGTPIAITSASLKYNFFAV